MRKRMARESWGRSFHDDMVIAKIRERGTVTQEDVDSVKKWYDYEMRFPNPFMQNQHVLKDLCEDIFDMWENKGLLDEAEMQKVENDIKHADHTFLAGLNVYRDALITITNLLLMENAARREEMENESETKVVKTMKKLNITKEQFNKSQYLQKKYGKLEYVSESGKYFKTNMGKVLKFVKESASDIANDPAYECPYCGSHDCEFEDAEEIGTGLTEGYFDGATFNTQFWCNECGKPYNVQFELKVKDVYPNEDADELTDDYI